MRPSVIRANLRLDEERQGELNITISPLRGEEKSFLLAIKKTWAERESARAVNDFHFRGALLLCGGLRITAGF
jgi:hypothetical protein